MHELNAVIIVLISLGSNVDRVRERMTRTVVVVVVIFLICHVPYYVMEQVALFIHQRKARNGVIPTKEEAKMFIYCNVIAQVLMFVNSCCNPVIYGLFNRNYRKYSNNSDQNRLQMIVSLSPPPPQKKRSCRPRCLSLSVRRKVCLSLHHK